VIFENETPLQHCPRLVRILEILESRADPFSRVRFVLASADKHAHTIREWMLSILAYCVLSMSNVSICTFI